MKEHHSEGPRTEDARGIATFALVGSRLPKVPEFGGTPVVASNGEQAARFDLASEAVRAAVAAVANDPKNLSAAVTTGEFDSKHMRPMLDRLRAMNAVAQPGQVVVSLATQEIVRTSAGGDLEFMTLGSTEVLPGYMERLFLVVDESLRGGSEVIANRTVSRRVTAFLGRSRELEEVRRQLDLSRIVSIVGPSGIGKTALLQRLMTDIEGDFRDGVAMIDLSAIAQPALLEPTLVRLLGVAKLPGESQLDALVAHLRGRQTMLVLDNAEHLISELRRVVTSLVDACPDLGVVVGSHRPLRVAGEWRYKLEGMETPSFAEDWRVISEYDAVSLFVDRAQMVDPRFRLDEKSAPAVAALCQKLDGIPLAIELAAAKTQTLSPRQILNRLDDRFLLLKDADESRPDRQRTLEMTVAWGYQHLRAEAQSLLRRLSVFQGAFTVDQAAEVCTDSTLSEAQVLPAFEELVDASMLAAASTPSSEKRFHLTETIRIFARARLKEAKEETTFAKRHRDWCLGFAEAASGGLSGPAQADWLDKLDASYEDVRSVIEKNIQRGGDGKLAVHLLLAIYPFFLLRLYLNEGLRLCDKVSTAEVCQKTPELHRVLNLGAHIASMLADEDAAREYAIRSIRLARKSGDKAALARARATLGHRAGERGRSARARRHYLAALRGFRELGDHHRLARVLVSIAVSEPLLGLFDEAREHLLEAQPLVEKDGDPMLQAYFHQNWAHVALADRNPTEALTHISQALPIFVAGQEKNGIATCMRNAAYAYDMLGAHKLAARFVGAGLNQSSTLEKHMKNYEIEAHKDLLERLREALGPEVCDFEVFQGTTMTLEEATALIAK